MTTFSAADNSYDPNLRGLATISYRLGAYSDWEARQHAMKIRTARDLEFGLKWDGVTTSYRGKEFDLIRDEATGVDKSPHASGAN